MTTIVLKTQINASPETCFDLMRDVSLHEETTVETNEKAVDGVTSGLIGLGQTVTFEGTHFGIRQRLTVVVTEYERPRRFVDEMTKGAFRSFKHTHEFESIGDATLMTDTIEWVSPLGWVGRSFDKVVLEKHLRDLVTKRNKRLKELAERRKDLQV